MDQMVNLENEKANDMKTLAMPIALKKGRPVLYIRVLQPSKFVWGLFLPNECEVITAT